MDKIENTHVRIGLKADSILEKQAQKWNLSKKEIAEFSIKFCSDIDVDPRNYSSVRNVGLKKNFNAIKAINELESKILNKISESRNTYIAFIKEMEKERINPINEKLVDLTRLVSSDNKILSLTQSKNIVALFDHFSALVIDDKKEHDRLVNKFISIIHAH